MRTETAWLEGIVEVQVEWNIDRAEVWYLVEKSEELNFSSEDVTENKTKKQKLEEMYNQMAIENWYESIEEFYVKKKFELAMKWEKYSKWDDYMNNLLKSIAADLWYWSSSKEFIMQNALPKVSWKQAIMG